MVSELEKLTTHVTKAWTMSRAYKQGFASCFRGLGAISDAPHIRPCYEDTRVPPFSPQYQGRGGGEKVGKKNILPCTSYAVFGLLYGVPST